MASYRLPYGRDLLEAPLPDSARVTTLLPRPVRTFDDPHAAYLESLESPIEGPPLKELARRATGRALIVCTDHTRVCGRERSLPWLLDALNGYGIPDERITIVMALGSHTPPPSEKAPGIVGPAAQRVEVVLHDTGGPMADCGMTSTGTPVRVNPILKEAGLVILSSAATHHYFAGYSGGRKLILPGLSSPETIQSNHSLVWLREGEGDGIHPLATSGVLDGNPVHEDMIQAARLALADTPHFTIVAVLSPDKEFGHFAGGELDAAHRSACAFVDRHNSVEIDRLADCLLASAGGYPKDLDLVQSHKGLDNAVRALKPGGTLLFVMSCMEGLKDPIMEEFAPLDLDEMRARLMERYEVYGHTAHAIKRKTGLYRVVCVSELDPALLVNYGMVPARDIGEALELIREDIERAQSIYHLPRADLTLPRLNQVRTR